MYFPSFDDDIPHQSITDHLATAALRGWTPDDLRHALGPVVAPYLSAAYPEVVRVAHPRIAGGWDRQITTAMADAPSVSDDEEWTLLHELSGLPPFRDADTYADARVLLSDAAGPELSAEQRRARQRITGLLRKAESTTFAAEAESLVAKAQELRQRYRLTHALDGDGGELGAVVSVRVHLHAPWVRFQFLLLGAVAVPNACRTVLSASIGIATLVGHPDDVAHCLELFASLNHQRDYFMRHSPGAAAAKGRRQTAAYRRSFLFAYATRIGDLLEAATTEAPAGDVDSSAALPVLVRREVAAEETRDRIFPLTSGMRFGHSHHGSGAADGVAAAENSHLGPVRTGLNSA